MLAETLSVEQRSRLLNSIADAMAKRGRVSAAIAGADGIPAGVLQVKDRREGYTFILTPRFAYPSATDTKRTADEITIRFSPDGKPASVQKRLFTQTFLNGKPLITPGPAVQVPPPQWRPHLDAADTMIQRFANGLERTKAK